MSRDFTLSRSGSRVVFGAGASARLDAELGALGVERALIVCTPGRAQDARALGATLGARAAGVLAIAREHVPVELVTEAERELSRAAADAVVAYGGGSAVGLAKALARSAAIRVAAVPTTYSGSEVTPIWGVTEDGEKRTGRDERVRPSLVVYDPELTRGLPLRVTVPSLWNAMAHAVEALWMKGLDRAQRFGAEEGLRLLASSAARIVAGLDDASARADALEGAYLAAAAFGDAGAGLHHKLCHALGGALSLPHAETHAALLPHVVRLCRDQAGRTPEVARALTAMARALGVVDPVRELDRLARVTGAPRSLARPLVAEERARVARAVAGAASLEPFAASAEALDRLLARASAAAAREAARPAPPALRAPASLSHLPGFGGVHESEALPGALPRAQNAPRHPPYGLYSELVNGSPFTMRRSENLRSWLYRIRPSASHGPQRPIPAARFAAELGDVEPDRVRWRPAPLPEGPAEIDLLDGLVTLGASGEATGAPGFAVHLYAANADMRDRCFSSADGDLLLVPQSGTLDVRTELGWLRAAPGTVILVPRGIKFAVGLPDGGSRGWMLEALGAALRLPERGPIGSNGLADARHFLAPIASWEDRACPDGFELVTKLGGKLFTATQEHSPFDVVAWHGNHAPRSYDLRLFNAMQTGAFDHADPSIHTVLTAPLDDHGRAAVDFVAFVGRWDVSEHTFRPPSLHRNAASEINGVISDPSPGSGYDPGCTFLTPLLTAHGVSTRTYESVLAMSDADADRPRRIPDESLWIMFESALPLYTTAWARETPLVDAGFADLFTGLASRFDPANPEKR